MTIDFKKNREALKTKRMFGYTLLSIALALVVVGGFLVAFAMASIGSSRADVASETVALGPSGETPALHLMPVLAPSGAGPDSGESSGSDAVTSPASPLGTVIVVHGFSGTKEMMRNIDYTLARGGFEVYGVDLPGHGHSLIPLDSSTLEAWFTDLTQDMVAKGLLTPGRVYLVGHSLGTTVVTEGALGNPDLGIGGVVALSPVFGDITTTQPANYLAIFAQGELAGVKDTALKALRLGTGLEDPALETIYGDYAMGTARSAGEIPRTTHITIVDAKAAAAATLKWLQSSAGQPDLDTPRVEHENAERNFGLIGSLMLFLGISFFIFGGLGFLGHGSHRPESRAFVEDARVAAGLPAKQKAPAPGKPLDPEPDSVLAARDQATKLFTGTRAIPLLYAVVALLSVLVPGFLGTFGFVHQPGVDYMVEYLLVFAVLMIPLLIFMGRILKVGTLVQVRARLGVLPALLMGLVSFGLTYLIVGGFESFAWTAVWPPAWRWGNIAFLVLLFAPFAAVDEIVRASVHDRTGFWWGFLVPVMGKLLFIISWYAALFLLPNKPQALLVVAPVLIGALVVLDLAASVVYQEHGNWVANAFYKALALAWLAGTVFPMVTGSLGF